jgi:1-aminocyclopropane-1-carboxylate deaminase/D-cysteine desulfhydrase-like pyridoxal-dependent ACC family enzyme
LGIPLEPVYLTKCCLALEDWFLHCLKDSVMTAVEKAVLLWHTGGLQGNR